MRTGISLYFASGYEANAEVVAKAQAAGCHYAFTSLQIPEEEGIDYRTEARKLLELCRKAEINLIADVSPATLSKLGVQKFDELAELGITYVRLDFGFDAAETVELSRKFHVVFNASTITKDAHAFRRLDSRFSRLFLARFSAVLSTRDCQLSRNTVDFRAMRLFRQCLRFMMQTLTWCLLATQMLLNLRGSVSVSLSETALSLRRSSSLVLSICTIDFRLIDLIPARTLFARRSPGCGKTHPFTTQILLPGKLLQLAPSW